MSNPQIPQIQPQHIKLMKTATAFISSTRLMSKAVRTSPSSAATSVVNASIEAQRSSVVGLTDLNAACAIDAARREAYSRYGLTAASRTTRVFA